jgi:hypothetical protein
MVWLWLSTYSMSSAQVSLELEKVGTLGHGLRPQGFSATEPSRERVSPSGGPAFSARNWPGSSRPRLKSRDAAASP